MTASANVLWLKGEEDIASGYDWIVSRGYRRLIPADVYPGRALNLHISLLPLHRGADPNFWSHVFGTRGGVTIHAVDAQLDTGPIYAQREVLFSDDDTLRTSYNKLQQAMDALWEETWPRILAGLQPAPQSGPSMYHKSADKEALRHLLVQGWDTPIADLRRCASEMQLSRAFFANAKAHRR